MRERLPISRRHPWVGAPLTPTVFAQGPRPLVVRFVGPERRPQRGAVRFGRLLRPTAAPILPRALRFHRRAELPRRGFFLVTRPRNPTPAAGFPPTARVQVWLTYQDVLDVRLTREDRVAVELTHQDSLTLFLTDHSHAG